LLIATPNLTVDRTVRLTELRPGSVLRPSRAVVTAGGKGVNVGRVAAALGRRATLVGFVAEVDASVLTRLLALEPLELAAVPVPGEARVSTIYLEDSGRVTVLNEPGPTVSADDWWRYEQRIAAELASGRHETLICSGSLPPGVPDHGYGRLVDIGHEAGVRVVVDAARGALARALPAGPDFVTPNLAEADGVLSGHAREPVDETGPRTARHACAAVRALCERGARSAAVTAGAAGTAFGDVRDAYWLPTVPVRVVNPIGAGDSFVAGLVRALEVGRNPVDAVTFATATATASVEQELAGGVDPERAGQIAARLAGAAVRAGDLFTESVM
jgi:1-phosphofructokinase family hexose kinase